ncbi:lamin tail domain-containing protein [Actinoplanes sp. NEAU-A11]|uniref:Lamin tail domain-containing protein n=2 Tax=Actinoplanes aureus TaxID=2792083 RepID=A0A931C1U1_9ACTN|nr:lamin tail domain-containing protein [Actinoplanes aureus]
MVGTKDGFSNRRYAAVRVQAGLSAEPNGAGAVSFQVNVNPGQAGFPVIIQRYNGTAWVQAGTGATSGEGAAAGWGDVLTGLPAGAHTFRAYVGNFTDGGTADEKADFASATNLIIANYSNNVRVTVAGSPATDSTAPSGSNPVPNPTIADPDGGPVDNPNPSPSSSSPSPSPSTSKPPVTPTKPPATPTKPPAAPAGPAVGSVQFTRIQFNAPGKDTRKNKSINGEYYKLTNKTNKTINLKGWTVRDRAGNLYRFTSTYNLGAGKSVIVHTGKGTNKSTVRYWGKTKHVWNNGGDTATLRTPANKTIDTCRWTKPGKGWSAC